MMSKKYKMLLIIVIGLVSLDQVTKLYIDSHMTLHQSIEVVKNFFQITYIRNSGAAFGIMSGVKSPWLTGFFIFISLVVTGIILFYYHKTPEDRRLALISFSLILSGATGNFIDRIFHGEVIDFLYFHWYKHYWPAFNVADSCITVGVSLLLWDTVFSKASLKTKGHSGLPKQK